MIFKSYIKFKYTTKDVKNVFYDLNIKYSFIDFKKYYKEDCLLFKSKINQKKASFLTKDNRFNSISNRSLINFLTCLGINKSKRK